MAAVVSVASPLKRLRFRHPGVPLMTPHDDTDGACGAPSVQARVALLAVIPHDGDF